LEASFPSAGDRAGQELSSQACTIDVAGASEEPNSQVSVSASMAEADLESSLPVPDLFSAGAERMILFPAAVNAL